MSQSGNRIFDALMRHRLALIAGFLVMGLVQGSCIYKARPVESRDCCEGGIQLEVTLANHADRIAISWSGTLLEATDASEELSGVDTVPAWKEEFDEACEQVRIVDGVATCKPRDGLRAGRWALQISVDRLDGAGNRTPIDGSTFTCPDLDVPSMRDGFGVKQVARRTTLRIVEGSEFISGCVGRNDRTPIALYDFEEGDGTTVINRMGDSSLDMNLQRGGVELPDGSFTLDWQDGDPEDGHLRLSSATLIATDGPAASLIAALQASNQLTVEAWVAPAESVPTGSSDQLARIVTLSADTRDRNFTLGQQDDRYVMRLRRASGPLDNNTSNGLPPVETQGGALITELTHVVATYDAAGDIILYLNGTEAERLQAPGDFSAWAAYPLALGDEINSTLGPRAWYGDYHLVAIYGEALSTEDVQQNFAAGPYYNPD